jgi:hypothetical protein
LVSAPVFKGNALENRFGTHVKAGKHFAKVALLTVQEPRLSIIDFRHSHRTVARADGFQAASIAKEKKAAVRTESLRFFNSKDMPPSQIERWLTRAISCSADSLRSE